MKKVKLEQTFIRPEGIYACQGCGTEYVEYINGCIDCWDDELSIEENHKKYPNRSVRLKVPASAEK